MLKRACPVPQSGVASGVTADDVTYGSPRGRRFRRIAVVVSIALIVGLVVLWTQRKPIASNYIDKALAQRGVPARYRIADLGFNRQRLTNVVIGDPAHPDLVADWIELRTGIGLSGASVTAIRAGHVRINARLIGGTLSLGAIDKLMPAPSGKPFTLPAIVADIQDARIRLVAPQGVVGIKLSGQGRLDNGFVGQIAAISERLDMGSCVAGRTAAALKIRISGARPSLSGPIHAANFDCGGVALTDAGADIAVTLDENLAGWRGDAKLAVAAIRHPAAELRMLTGSIGFAGTASDTAGMVDLKAGPFATRDVGGGAMTLAGRYRLAGAGIEFDGKAGARQALLVRSARVRLAAYRDLGAGTPVAPLIRQLVVAADAAAQSADIDADIALVVKGGQGRATMSRLALASVSGAWAKVGGGAGIGYAWPGGGVRFDGSVQTGGGNLPQADIRVSQARAGAPVTGTATVQPYAAGNARLALAPIGFAATPGGVTRLSTRMSLSGPLGDGRVDDLGLPIVALWDGRDRLQVNRSCAPLSFGALTISSLKLRAATIALCPVEGAMFRLEGGRIGGGVTSGALRLSGALGSTALALSATGATLFLRDTHGELRGVDARIGALDRVTHLSFARTDFRFSDGAARGMLDGGGGQIANVPLLVSQAHGAWRFAGGAFDLVGGTLRLADAAPVPRFQPLAGDGVWFRLTDNHIIALAGLKSPDKGALVSNVSIEHDLSNGSGHAYLAVPGITFSKDLQPSDLTRLTYGVIADVVGTVSGEGHIRWNNDGVTSDGTFRTAGTDLAAAFGPVTGIAGEIRFTDLLNLETAPGQVATVTTINPGIAVNDGTIRYQLLAGTRIKVEEGRWPFAGGALVLEPTLLDFGEHQERRMTFTVTGMDAGQFLQQFDFKNLDATGIFDGTLPMIFDEKGGRIENGRLTVRPGGGTIAYVGEISQKDVGFWGNLAFQALKSLCYQRLDLVMNGPLAGEMITEVRFAGVGQGAGAKRNFILDRLQKLPFIFNVRIKAPFRGLIDSAASFYDPKRLIQRNLPALLEEQRKRAQPPAKPPAPVPAPIQPAESEKLP
jgi:translocation and assembly module TamB